MTSASSPDFFYDLSIRALRSSTSTTTSFVAPFPQDIHELTSYRSEEENAPKESCREREKNFARSTGQQPENRNRRSVLASHSHPHIFSSNTRFLIRSTQCWKVVVLQPSFEDRYASLLVMVRKVFPHRSINRSRKVGELSLCYNRSGSQSLSLFLPMVSADVASRKHGFPSLTHGLTGSATPINPLRRFLLF